MLLAAGAALGVAAVLALLVARKVNAPGRDRPGALPGPGSETYREVVSEFYAGVAALDVDAKETAQARFDRAIELVPAEPASWADRGLLKLRVQDYEGAARDLGQAQALAPESGAVERLLGLLEIQRAHEAQAIAHLRRAAELAPQDLKARFALAREIERQSEPGSDAEALRLLAEMEQIQPENLAVLLERARLVVKERDGRALDATVARLGRLAASWPQKAQEAFHELEKSASADIRGAATRVIALRNLLVQTPAFQRNLALVQTPAINFGEPIETFLRLPPPPPTPAPADGTLSFVVEPIPTPAGAPAHWEALVPVSLTGQGPPALFAADGRTVRRVDGAGMNLPFPGGAQATAPAPAGVLAVDWNSDYRMDLVLAGAGGVRIFQQADDGSFADVTAAAKLEPTMMNGDAFGVWPADIESDGDLDLVVAARQGPVTVLLNKSDGTFGTLQPFGALADVRDFGWADLDADGDPDAVLLDARGSVHVFSNERAGKFERRAVPDGLGSVAALAVIDWNGDGVIDVLTLRPNGWVTRLSDRDEGRGWQTAAIAGDPTNKSAPTRLFVADLDNNGAFDVIAAGATGGWIALADNSGALVEVAAPAGFRIAAVTDLNGDGKLDLAGLTASGQPARALGRGAQNYHWQVIRPRGTRTFGDGRINSFGLGGEVEVRAGLLVQKQVITGPVVHFGLGNRPRSDVARIVWPNGTAQAEFAASADTEVLAQQRLKGSCPFLYAFDGVRMHFVTDFIWRSPLGLRINAQDTAGVAQTEDWVKIRGAELAPRDGSYDIRITGELWETHYWDHVALLVVDHPAASEVFVDERFARRPPPLAVQLTGPLYPLAYACDQQGRDVTDVVAARDGRYTACPTESFYQGVTREHWLEVQLGDDTPQEGPLRLVAHGWIHPTDSSINVAIGQGRHPKPQGIVLDVQTPTGGWAVARDDLGFPAGKNKTILIDLDGVFARGAPRRLRLRTNLEIHWDSLAVAAAAPATPIAIRRLAPHTAELRARGFSVMTQADASAPELPDYEGKVAGGQRWRDLAGFYTRFGDVRELLERVDDRYVIANAGDELALRFQAPPGRRSGWVRDFVLIGDGWNKDGDFNTEFSKTVLPLPSHRQPGTSAPPGALEDDPVYRLHASDWREYHTRYVTPRDFQMGAQPRLEARPAPWQESHP